MKSMFKKRLIETLKGVINSLEEDLEKEKQKNRVYQNDMVILLDTNRELRAEKKDLENNIEFLTNNLSAAKKKQLGL